MDITCVTGGNGQLVFCDSEGGITICNQDYSLHRFKAHEGCINFAYLVLVQYSVLFHSINHLISFLLSHHLMIYVQKQPFLKVTQLLIVLGNLCIQILNIVI